MRCAGVAVATLLNLSSAVTVKLNAVPATADPGALTTKCVAVPPVTVSVALLLLIPKSEAVMLDVPVVMPVATPALVPPETIVATVVFEDAQVTVDVIFWVEASL